MTKRSTTTQRGYGARHTTLRNQWEHRLNRGETHTCARCGKPISKYDKWDLGHTEDRTDYTGPEHIHCNRSAGAKNSAKTRRHQSTQRKITRYTW